MIIQADEALLINSAESNPGDEEGVQARQKEIYHEFEKRMSEPGRVESADVPELPYELRAVEAALEPVLSNLHRDFTTARDKAEQAARNLKLESGAGSIGLDRVFERTRTLAKIESKARYVHECIREVLDNDDDLAMMYLSDRLAGKPHDICHHSLVEELVEEKCL